jgi:hypothetical protein
VHAERVKSKDIGDIQVSGQEPGKAGFAGTEGVQDGGFEFHKFGKYSFSVLQPEQGCFEYWVPGVL